MTFTEQEVERIVVEVIRRLGLLGSPPLPIGGSTNNRELMLNDKVVALRSIEGRLAGVCRLVIAKRAVVTPAVRDELKQRKIELVRQTA